MPTEIPKLSNAHFRKIPENLSHIFDANVRLFLPERKIYISTEKIIEKLTEFLAEILGGDRPYWFYSILEITILFPALSILTIFLDKYQTKSLQEMNHVLIIILCSIRNISKDTSHLSCHQT